jgi:superfamily II DNA/RNA helicase
MQHAANSYRDLNFLLPNAFKSGRPPSFLVFFDCITEAEVATQKYCEQLPEVFQNKVAWFHSHMSADYRAEKTEMLRTGELWGAFVTDAFGMVCFVYHIQKLLLTL